MTINYDIGTPRKDGRMRISLILSIGKTKKRIHTDFLATKADLNRQGKLKNDSPIYIKVKEAMVRKEREFSSLDTFITGEKVSANEAYGRMTKKDIPTFFEFSKSWLERADMKGKKNYSSALNSFRTFLKGNDISFNMFSHKLLEDFCYFLKDKKRAQSLYLNAIKKIYDDAEKDYDIIPFSKMRFIIPKQNTSQHRALDADILRKIFSYKGTAKRAMLARDCCILSFCLCGTNAADLYHAPKYKGNTICYDRCKTKDRREDKAHIEIDIPMQIASLISKYKGTYRAFVFSQDYASVDNFGRAINIGLKTIRKWLEEKEGISLDFLTFYAIRHSWATIARNDLGIDKSTVNDALNHTDPTMRITDIYIKKDFSQINIANKKVVEYIFSSI